MTRDLERYLQEHVDELMFFVRAPSRKVHVVRPLRPVERPNPDNIFTCLKPRTIIACGRTYLLQCDGGDAVPVVEFRDEDLCWNCYLALGSQSARAYQHPQPAA
ncbi:hypothetical protein [Nonomuraea sp. SYSU D8015]|uniref:hypothetical protein n=1 Tax=Nonomuraea sp. SYSU D8015 TaxID=2593644 RepID=UPI001660D8B4|nr:hypothetical protein [Nonomuraea sp. SYSU D8015]